MQTTLFRAPEDVSAAVKAAFYSLANNKKLEAGTPVWAQRLIRRESFSESELKQLEKVIDSELFFTGRVLAAEVTLPWIESVLNPGAKVLTYLE